MADQPKPSVKKTKDLKPKNQKTKKNKNKKPDDAKKKAKATVDCVSTNAYLRAVDTALAKKIKSDMQCAELTALLDSMSTKYTPTDAINKVSKYITKTMQCHGDVITNIAKVRRVIAGITCSVNKNKTGLKIKKDPNADTSAPELPKGYVIPRVWNVDWTPQWAKQHGWIRDPYYDWLMPVRQVPKPGSLDAIDRPNARKPVVMVDPDMDQPTFDRGRGSDMDGQDDGDDSDNDADSDDADADSDDADTDIDIDDRELNDDDSNDDTPKKVIDDKKPGGFKNPLQGFTFKDATPQKIEEASMIVKVCVNVTNPDTPFPIDSNTFKTATAENKLQCRSILSSLDPKTLQRLQDVNPLSAFDIKTATPQEKAKASRLVQTCLAITDPTSAQFKTASTALKDTCKTYLGALDANTIKQLTSGDTPSDGDTTKPSDTKPSDDGNMTNTTADNTTADNTTADNATADNTTADDTNTTSDDTAPRPPRTSIFSSWVFWVIVCLVVCLVAGLIWWYWRRSASINTQQIDAEFQNAAPPTNVEQSQMGDMGEGQQYPGMQQQYPMQQYGQQQQMYDTSFSQMPNTTELMNDLQQNMPSPEITSARKHRGRK